MSKYKRKEELDENELTYSQEMAAEVAPEPQDPEESSFKKRYGDLRRHTQQQLAQKDREIAQIKDQLDSAAKGQIRFPKTDEEIEAWAKKYPDVAGIVEAIATKKADEKAASLDTRLKEIEELRVTAKREKAEAELAALHPDFGDIRADDVFHEWAKDQPKWVQDALYENVDDAKSVARVIDLYKVDKGITGKVKSNNDKEAASSVKTKRNTTPEHDEASKYLSESQVAKMSMKEYEKRMEEIFEAQRQGKFIYDVSRK